MSRWKRTAIWLGAFVALAVYADYVYQHLREKRALGVAFSHGARCGSIGGWPLGKEYVITFPSALDAEELASLRELNALRGFVSISFDEELTAEQVADVERALPECHI